MISCMIENTQEHRIRTKASEISPFLPPASVIMILHSISDPSNSEFSRRRKFLKDVPQQSRQFFRVHRSANGSNYGLTLIWIGEYGPKFCNVISHGHETAVLIPPLSIAIDGLGNTAAQCSLDEEQDERRYWHSSP